MIGGDAQRPVAIDFFAGAGGLSLGFEQAGFDVVAANEIDPIHAAIHKLNFPLSEVICGDIRKLTGLDIRAAARLGDRDIDVVIGGPPCQGFSLIGHRVLEDARNELVFHFLRLVTELQPRLFLMENVPGMATGRHHQLLDELIERFQDAGYQLQLPFRILNAAEYGVPQERRRLFLIGAREGVDVPDYPCATTRRRSGRTGPTLFDSLPDALPYCPSVADAICDLPDIDSFPELFDSDELRHRPSGGSLYARQLRGDALDPSDFGHPRIHDPELLTGCLRANHTPLSRSRFAETQPGTTEPISRFYRLALDGTSNTLRAGTASDRGAFSAPRPIHPVYPRCISVREAARLHSFPDWFRFHRTIWHGFRQIGNAVPPLLARAIGHEYMRALTSQPQAATEPIPMGNPQFAFMDMRHAAAAFGVSHTIIAPRRRVNTSETV